MFKLIAMMGVVAYLGTRYGPSIPYLPSFVTGILFFAIQAGTYFVYATRIYPFYLSPFKNVPIPEGADFWSGHGRQEVGTAGGSIQHIWSKQIKNAPARLDIWRYITFGGAEKIIMNSAEASRQLMNNPAMESPIWFREGSKPILGAGLVTAEGPTHRALRKSVAPAFTPAQVRSFCPIFWERAEDMVRRIRAEIVSGGATSREINMLDWTNRITIDMIGKTAYGADFGGLKDPTTGFYRMYNDNYPLEGFTSAIDAISIYVLPIFIPHRILDHLPIPAFQAEQKFNRESKAMYRRLIEQVDNSKFDSEEKDAVQKNLISVMVKGGQIPIDVMIENMMTFTGAGYGTNASAALWALYECCKRPANQTRLRNEIRSVLGSSSAVPTAPLMDQMRYLHWFVMETARLYPSIPASWREAMKDTEICGQVIPKGTQVIAPNFHTNRSMDTWGANAEEFEPERWAPERIKKGAEHDGSLMTYSVGPKACVGKEYSLRAIKSVLIALVGNFEFSYEGPELLDNLVPGLTLRPRGGFTPVVKEASAW